MWVSKLFEFTKKMTAHNESLDESIASSDIYFQKYSEVIFQSVFFLLWALSFYSFRIVRSFQNESQFWWKYFKFNFWESRNPYTIVSSSVARLSKKPNHIALGFSFRRENSLVIEFLKGVVFGENCTKKLDKNSGVIGLTSDQKRRVVNMVCWCWAAGIPNVSLYDPQGALKANEISLRRYIAEELNRCHSFGFPKPQFNLTSSKKPTDVLSNGIEGVTDQNDKQNGYATDLNGIHKRHQQPKLNIVLHSMEDGKHKIVQIARVAELQKSEVSESKLNSLLTLPDMGASEPEILVLLSNSKSLLGFLPWHIRLTEIFWLPHLDRIFAQDFLSVLCRYSRCEQRFGT